MKRVDVIIALVIAALVSIPMRAADSLTEARDLYAAAEYEDALALLNKIQPGDHAPDERRAIVFQRPTMLRRSAAANIRYASAGGDRTRELLALVGLEHAAERPARRLSAGEQQRLALARALARDPTILFLDEPTASLDPGSTKAVEDVIRTVSARGIKIVMSTHDLGEARRLAGEVVLLHRGRLVETGAASKFFDAPRTEEARRFIAGELLV